MQRSIDRLTLIFILSLISPITVAAQIIFGLDEARALRGNAEKNYFIQIASFSNKGNAERFYRAQQVKFGNRVVLRHHGQYYSVGIGSLSSAAAVRQLVAGKAPESKLPVPAAREKEVILRAKARILPVVSLFGGAGFYNGKPFEGSYLGTDDNAFRYYNSKQKGTVGLGGIFLGVEHALNRSGLFMQEGLSYTAFGRAAVKGQHLSGIEPETSTLYQYSYALQSQQLLAEARLFTTAYRIYHPNLSAGLGASFNRAKRFNAYTGEAGSVNLAPTYGNQNQTALSYSLGLGVDADISQHLRFGLGYRFSDLGKASLSSGAVIMNDYSFPTGFSLSTQRNYMNQLIAQVTFIPVS